jgi:branched-subunit amino acid transport protein
VTAVAAMVALGLICWVLRLLFIVVVPAERLPARVREALGHVAPAVLAALVAVDATSTARGGGPSVVAAVVATLLVVAAVVRRTGSLSLAVGISLAAALLLDLVLRR